MNTQNPTAQTDTNVLLQSLLERLAQQPASTGSPFAPPLATPFAPRPTSGPPEPVGLLVPVTLETPAGHVRCYAQFGPDGAANPQALVASLQAAGWPVAAWGGNKDIGGWSQGRRPFRRFS